jgi:hypothetical protein
MTFHAFPAPPETAIFWNWIKEHHPDIKRLATISPDDDTGWWSIKVEVEHTKELGYEVVAQEFFGYRFKPGHRAPSMTCREDLARLPGHGQLVDL